MNNDIDKLNKYIRKVLRISLILLFSIAILINLAIFSPLTRSLNASIIVISAFAGGLFSGLAILSYCVLDIITIKKP
ncbi:TPA: hypothetical protein JIZ13_14450 [Acinetobacter nosocomialis]|jgi:hypothetical protein|uniref:Uncharacterized protein n=2 Tax=Gammaproteobacteria TaxID=1236 RepID=A0A1L5TNE1_ACIBA|nr:hypothetical protein ACX60_18465 [Acinetobacter baumannii]QDQ51897.1 hypothetical protein E5A71_08115 [Acinetobacter baumannii ATCC 17978]HAV4990511.1 hypothetical protein [Acinetobacter nosocomialis]APP30770.1 hypothetical protein AUO97_08080 [Acinetobacter baumannii]APX49239.1 hypothetical protein AT570_08075 [Acinetobacter baumannii]